MKPENPAGCEGVSCRILKYCAHIIRKPLSHNASLRSRIYHDRSKYAIVMSVNNKKKAIKPICQGIVLFHC
jgi:transcriptional accessory protein Tex/SPT6